MEFTLERTRALLARTPGVLRAWLTDLPADWTDHDEGPGTWSPAGIVGHLLHGELEDWIPRARLLLENGEARPFEPFDWNGWPSVCGDLDLAARLDRFEVLRAESLAALDGLGLTEADLDRTGTHPAFGPVTLRQLLATWCVHDQNHLAQLARVLAGAYRDEVGPWREYLPLLRPRG